MQSRQRSLFVPVLTAAGLLLCCSAQAADRAGPFPPGSTPHFRHIANEDGLANSDVHVLQQDAAGYMWIGTDNGLQRYDGYHFVTWRHDPEDPASLAQNIITSLAFAPDGKLWIGTQSAGLDVFDPSGTQFVHRVHDSGKAGSLADNDVYALLFDTQGRLWVGTDAGVERLDAPAEDFRHYHTGSTLPNGERILSLYQAQDGRIWVGSDHGVFYYDEQHDKLARFAPRGGKAAAQAMPVLDTAPIILFYGDRARRLWIGSEHGIAVVGEGGDINTFYTAQPGKECALQSDHTRGLLEDDGGDFWFALLHGGLERLDPESGCFTAYHHDATDPGSLKDDDPRVLYRDHTGLFWIGTYYSGVDIYNPRTRVFGYYHAHPGDGVGLADNVVSSIYKQPDGTLWVGTVKGLTRLDAARRRYRQYVLPGRPASAQDDTAVNALLGDREGRFWVGTDYGIAQYQPASDSFSFHRLVDAKGDPYQTSVTYLFEDASARLWVGTEAGLLQFDPATGGVTQRFVPDPSRRDALPDPQVNALCQSRDGAVWVGTLKGLSRFDGVHDHFQTYSEGGDTRHALSSSSIMSCLGSADGRVWVGSDSGLDALDPRNGGVQRFGLADGLPNLNIAGILQDVHGDLWVATDEGVTRLSSQGEVLRNYSEPDGLQRGEFNDGAAFGAADGEMFFGGSNGLNSFYPAALGRDVAAPTATVTGFTVSNKLVPLVAGVVPQVPYQDKVLGFELAAFDYAEPSHNRFRYQLEGFDGDWRTTNGEHAITYTNLDPGHYVLHVKGSRDGLHWSEGEATVAIQVLPPLWRSWWAYIGYVLAVMLVGGGGIYLFVRSVKRRQAYAEERNRRRWAEALHQLIQAVTALEDEHAIVACLLDSLMQFITYDRALFYSERDTGLTLIGARGGGAVEQLYHERWPTTHAAVATQLRRDTAPRMLTRQEAATLEPPGQGARHYMVVPLASGNSAFRLLLVGRESKTIEVQGLDIAAAMAKQVSVALDRALLVKDLEKLATTDSLTRLHIRRSVLQKAELEFERSRRYQRALSVLMLDVDHFKRVNDSYGHETGDRVLRVLADTCRASLRQQDMLGRYGGEEFIAFLPETSAEVAQEAAERVRRNVEDLAINSPQGPLKITISIGVATLDRSTGNIGTLINAADRALYEAKQKGRNRVVVSP